MPKDFDPTKVDETVTAEEIAQAHDAEPAPFPLNAAQDEIDTELVPSTRGFVAIVPATPRQALLNARALRVNRTNVGIGMCLATVRGPVFGLPALWSDAAAAMDHSDPFHALTSNVLDAPRGSVGFASNGGHGHTWLNLGGGLASTTDFHVPGFEGVALISRMLEWCGAITWGWGEVLNGFDVWPLPHAAQPKPRPWGLAERERVVHRDLHRARVDGAAERRLEGLKVWDDKLVAKLERHGITRLPR